MNDTIKMPRGWKRIPVPDDIDVLPKDRKGFPIPYVAEWSNHRDRDDYTSLMEQSDNHAILMCSCERGEGEPILGHQCPMRQRECMVERRCQVCSLEIPEDEDCYFLGGAEIDVFWEPPLHFQCALYSMQVCPGITRRRGLFVTTSRQYALFDRFEFAGAVIGIHGDTEMVPHGSKPFVVAFGLRRGVITYHGAKPIGGTRTRADLFLEMHNG